MWSRPILPPDTAKIVSEHLQGLLTDLIDLSLVSKQAHWNLFGDDFLAAHEKLDEVVASARNFGDLVAERIAKLGVSPDGRVKTVAAGTAVAEFPAGFHPTKAILTEVCDRLDTVVKKVRIVRQETADHDPMTDDLCIEIGRELETHFWMLQAMEGRDPSDR